MVWAVLNEDHNIALNELLHGKKSDRIVAIIGGALVDDSLRRHLELRFRGVEKGHTNMNDFLFRPGGPLGFLTPKIHLAYQLYMFEKPVRNTLCGIADIRNLFAHNLNMSFESKTDRMTSAMGKLTLHQGRSHYPDPLLQGDSKYPIERGKGRRHVFIVNLQFCLIHLMRDGTSHGPWSNIPRDLLFPSKRRA
jgi:hypothetical protein